MLNQSLNGTLRVGNETVRISRTHDFNDFLTQATAQTQYRAKQVLEQVCASLGETRSAMSDLYRERLQEMRTHLRLM